MKTKLLCCLCFALFISTANAQTTQLWGLTVDGGGFAGGTIFRVNPDGTGFNVEWNFMSPDGYTPRGNLCEASNGKLYGACYNGGSFYSCTVFCYDPSIDLYYDVYDFDIAHGDYPQSGVVEGPNGRIYGVASSGGAYGGGVIYQVDLATDIYTDIHDFNWSTDGSTPYSCPVLHNGKLYGTTFSGGTNNMGVIFSFDITNNTFANLYEFNSPTGNNPYGAMIMASNGKFYGATSVGGANGGGVIYSFDISGNNYQKLYDFATASGNNMQGAFMEAANGLLYGVTRDGGSFNKGVLFSFDIVTNTYTEIMDFDGTLGSYPLGNLTQDGNGKLAGTCSEGGLNNMGTMFSLDLNTMVPSVLFDFDLVSGKNPMCGFISVTTTGISSVADNDKLHVYPTPATDAIYISAGSQSAGSSLIIKNLTGQTMMSIADINLSESSKTKLDIKNLSTGMYFIEVNQHGKTTMERFIKN